MNKLKVLQCIMEWANRLVPKKNIILFNSYPAYSDNSRTLYEYILRNRPDITKKYKIIWGQEKGASIPKELSHYSIETIDKKSLKGIYTFLSAKYVFSTHGYFPGVKSGNGQVQINLWHGCGYKSITDADRIYRGDINTVTGSIYVPIHEKVFDMKQGTVCPTGLPRNDLLFTNRGVMPKLGIDKNKYKKIYIWMPTYRKANEGHKEVDGKADAFTISTMTHDELDLLNKTLKLLNVLLIVKPHPMDAKAFNNVSGFSNIKTITNAELKNAGVQLYEFMAETDALLSDYSSVVIDYLMLQKPVVMVMSDIHEYENSRGFVFENIKDYLPGPIITNTESLTDYFMDADQVDEQWAEKRNQLSRIFHDNLDGNSCKRVCNLIFGKTGKIKEASKI